MVFIKRNILGIILVTLYLIIVILHNFYNGIYYESILTFGVFFNFLFVPTVIIINIGRRRFVEAIYLTLYCIILGYLGPAAFVTIFHVCIIFLALSIISLLINKKNRFLSIISFLSFLITSVCIFGMLVSSFSFFGLRTDIIAQIGVITFLLNSLAIVFIFPNSGFVNWVVEHKRFFLRGVIIPWLFLFIIISARFVLPEVFIEDEKKYSVKYLQMEDYEVVHDKYKSLNDEISE